ncbi:MAG: glycosyltransferase [Chitinivibrionales bacterium]|nr:glycosyltransferase [Chitinivibrionales bacterium]
MKIVLFCHSLQSDWNNGNAHFQRGIVSELARRGHRVEVYEPENGWSFENLVRFYGRRPLREYHRIYPSVKSTPYQLENLNLDEVLDHTDLVIVHEWNDPELVRRIGLYRRIHNDIRVLFHDTHHRSFSSPEMIDAYAISEFDGVLAFGESIKHQYERNDWSRRCWVWHEAADINVFFPRPYAGKKKDLVWIGNWGDDERTEELKEFLLEPSRILGLSAHVYGVRYPPEALSLLASCDLLYNGWLSNFRVPEVFSEFSMTVHIPRRYYSRYLHGIPTIRPFEALACGIPLICALWHDSENLFTAGDDYLPVRNGREMQQAIRAVLNDKDLAQHLSQHGRQTIIERHTCSIRVDQLLEIAEEIGIQPAVKAHVDAD